MQVFIRYSVNLLYIMVILFVALSISAYAFIEKTDKDKQGKDMILGKVVKEEIPQIATADGFVTSIDKKMGDNISIDEKILTIAKEYHENEDTDSVVESKTTNSSDKGIIKKVYVKKGQNIKMNQAVASVLADDNILIVLNVDEEEYKMIKNLKNIYFYSNRLDQSFAVESSLLNPAVLGAESSSNSFQLNFAFKNPNESISLLHNEKVELLLPKEKEEHSWESFLSNFRH